MPNRDGTGPGGRGQRRNTPGCRGNQRTNLECQRGSNRRNQPLQNQNISGTSSSTKSIGMALIGLVTALLPLASRLDKLLSSNNKKNITGPENKTEKLDSPTTFVQIPEKIEQRKG